jgi:hypothetical protein
VVRRGQNPRHALFRPFVVCFRPKWANPPQATTNQRQLLEFAVVWFRPEYDSDSLEFEALTTSSSTIIPDNRISKSVEDTITA